MFYYRKVDEFFNKRFGHYEYRKKKIGFIQKIEEIKNVQIWNGYYAEPISDELISNTVPLILWLFDVFAGNIYIFPTANKTIQIEAYINKVAIEIEVDVNNINVLIDNENGITITINCRDSENNKTEVLKKIMNSMKFITDKVLSNVPIVLEL